MEYSILRDFLLGFIKIHILHHAGQAAIYGTSILEELRRHGYDLSPGTLYPTLRHLEVEGYLSKEERVVAGKLRKYYRITAKGLKALEEVKPKIRELVAEVLENNGGIIHDRQG
ncbi:MAG: PadR family transcriptional regulator [Firmicutes bacterium]|nr:PadR family transcriptional regulator [Bacillota bacterium]